jgi:hypothetical protein
MVCFVVTDVMQNGAEYYFEISRKKAQQQLFDGYINKLQCGDIIPCCVTHIDRFGAFCDVGYGIRALLPIDFVSVSRIQTSADRFFVGQNIYACIKSIDDCGKIVLTQKIPAGILHFAHIQFFRHHIHKSPLKNARLFRIPNAVTIGFRLAIQPGMEPGTCLLT